MKKFTPLLAFGFTLAGCLTGQAQSNQPGAMTDRPGAINEGSAISSDMQPGLAPGQHEQNGDVLPVLLKIRNPVYPSDLQRAGVGGVVVVDFIVGPDGTVVKATAISSPHPELSSAAVDAVLKARFRPALRNGKPLLVHLRMPITFAVPGAAAKGGAPALADIIFDRDGFIARLPRKCLTCPNFLDGVAGIGDATQAFNAALYELGEPKGVEFVELPSGFAAPRITGSRPPEFPDAKAGAQQSGHADFLVLIGRTGRIAALYCDSATDRLFAIAGANALVQWTFSPAYYSQQPLPVLVMARIKFTVILNGVPHNE